MIMNERQLLLAICGVIAMCLVPIGILIGHRRYKKYGAQILEEMKQQEREAQEKGGIHSLYYKRPYKRVFARTYGTPILICMLIGLIILLIIFELV